MLRTLQASRAVAAILVVLFHASNSIFDLPKYFGHKPFGNIFDIGFVSVDFFFVLSGFIIMHVHAKDIGQPRALGSYLWRRFSRAYPTYWVVLALLLPVYFLVPTFGAGWERDPDVIVTSVLLLPHPQTHLVLVVAWTLVLEVVFYLFFATLVLNRRLGIVVMLTWLAGILAYPWFSESLQPFVFNNMNLRILAGMGVALVVARWQIPWPRRLALIGAVCIFSTALWHVYVEPVGQWWQALGFTLGCVLVLAGCVQAERAGSLSAPGWLVYLGDATYSIYLVHFATLSVLAKIAKTLHLDTYLPSQLLFCLHVAGALGVGCLFHQLIDLPIQAWLKRRFRRTPAIQPPAVAEPALSRAA